jgi:hypothetical protein
MQSFISKNTMDYKISTLTIHHEIYNTITFDSPKTCIIDLGLTSLCTFN